MARPEVGDGLSILKVLGVAFILVINQHPYKLTYCSFIAQCYFEVRDVLTYALVVLTQLVGEDALYLIRAHNTCIQGQRTSSFLCISY
jgi:hypothetical protein